MNRANNLVSFLFLFSIVLCSCRHEVSEREKDKEEMNDWLINQRMYPYGNVDYAAYRQAVHYVRNEQEQMRRAGNRNIWEFAGPQNVGGRITDVEMHASSLQTMYICAASGGIFKSTDGGGSWNPIFDDQPSLSIGDLAIAPSNPDILYAGTGEANAGGGSLTYDGMGVFKSTDGGNQWTHVGLDSTRNTGRIAIHPFNPDIAYAATMGDLFGDTPQRGLYKTSDGGSSWQQVLFQNDSTGAIDVVVHPQNPDTVWACMWTRVRRPDRRHYGGPASGIYRSFDGGNSWTNLTSGLNLPGNAGRIGIAISQSDPDVLYATVTDEFGYNVSIYKSIDLGSNWAAISSPTAGDFGYWYGRIKVDPTDANIVYAVDFDLYKTTDGGLTWNQMSSLIHVDQHEVYIHPLNHDFVLLGNDGGLFTSFDAGVNWTHDESLPITQFYTCEVDEQNPSRLFGGAQDNGVQTTPSGSFNDWYDIWYGDGFGVLVDPNDPSYVYASSQYGNINSGLTGINTQDRFNWNTPFVLNPINTNSIYLASNNVYKSTDRGQHWTQISQDLTGNTGVAIAYPIVYETVTSISVSAADTNVIYAGTDDGHVWVTNNEGASWTEISIGLPVRWVTRVTADPHDAQKVYVTLSGYRYHDNMSHVYMTNNGGQSWNDIGGNLPDVPVNDLVIDTVNAMLYLGTDVGVFFTNEGGSNWQFLGTGMPTVPITDLRIHYPTMHLYAATYGRSMYKYDLGITAGVNTVSSQENIANMKLYPSLFSNHTTIEINLTDAMSGTLSLFDISGKQIKSFQKGNYPKGKTRVQLNLSDQEKSFMQQGIVFLNLQGDNGAMVSAKGVFMN